MDHKIHRLLNLGKFVIFEFESIANIDTVGEQCNCNFRNYTSGIVLDERIITANINHSTKHKILLYENPPLEFQGRVIANEKS